MCLLVCLQAACSRECLATVLACMWLLSCMCSLVCLQVACSRECLAAILTWMQITSRSFVRVHLQALYHVVRKGSVLRLSLSSLPDSIGSSLIGAHSHKI